MLVNLVDISGGKKKVYLVNEVFVNPPNYTDFLITATCGQFPLKINATNELLSC